MNKVLAIVVTYNRLFMLKQSIEHLLKQSYEEFDILVVDNNSDDGTQEYLKNFNNKNIKYLLLNENIGGAGGFNKGLRYACENNYDYCWLMDDDCFPDKTALEHLMIKDNLLSGNYGWLSSRVVWTDGKECLMNMQRKNPYKVIDGFDKEIVKCDMSTFVSFFIKTNVVKEVGLPIKDFFIWADDLEYSRRISKKYKCYAVRESVVVHAMKSNIGSSIADDDVNRLDRYNYAYRNENYLYRHESIKGFLYYLAKSVYNSLRVLYKHNKPLLKRLCIIYKNLVFGLFFNPEIEYVKEVLNE